MLFAYFMVLKANFSYKSDEKTKFQSEADNRFVWVRIFHEREIKGTKIPAEIKRQTQ